MKKTAVPFRPAAAEQAAVRAALDCGCKVDTSVITFFGRKGDRGSNKCDISENGSPAQEKRPQPARSNAAVPVFEEENETFC